MIVAALQPGYLPWAGFFDLMKRCDLFVIEDSLQYTKQDWRNRNRIRTAHGWAYLTVPVRKGPVERRINQVEIDNGQPWARKHLNLLRQNYCKAPFWGRYRPFIEESYSRTWTMLIDVDMWFIKFLRDEFDIDTPANFLSEVGTEFDDDKTGSLIRLTRDVGADTFLEGKSGEGFIDERRFAEAGLDVVFQDYTCKPYRQQFEPFISHLSALDLLLNEGPKSTELI